MNALPDHGAEGRSNWMVRGALLVVLVAAIFTVRQFVGSRSLRIAEAPQRVALVDVPAPPPREQTPVEQTPPPEEQTPALADGLDNGSALPDAGPSPIDDQLGLDSDAQAGFDAFGLRAKRGGRDLALDLGKPGRPGGGAGGFGNYASRVAGDLKSWLAADDDLRHANYDVRVQLWLDSTGAVSHCSIASGTGDAGLDRRLLDRISTACVKGEPPPSDLPQPITIVVRSHGAQP